SESIFDRGAHAPKRAYQRTMGSFIEPSYTTSSSGGLKMTVQRVPRGPTTHRAHASHAGASNESTTMPSGADGAEAAADAAGR
ncbi:MAG: hypothetical protein JWM74_637, partial [Myxococcaceae bacterium]|nr:hypothetical protein [Myxococcaceae bacterium]